jgi:hypothetical protein
MIWIDASHYPEVAGSYPPFLLLVIVAIGNHFLVDAAAGAAVAGVALLAARRLMAPPSTPASQRSPACLQAAQAVLGAF